MMPAVRGTNYASSHPSAIISCTHGLPRIWRKLRLRSQGMYPGGVRTPVVHRGRGPVGPLSPGRRYEISLPSGFQILHFAPSLMFRIGHRVPPGDSPLNHGIRMDSLDNRLCKGDYPRHPCIGGASPQEEGPGSQPRFRGTRFGHGWESQSVGHGPERKPSIVT